jgi:hypothetical protein
MTDPGYGHGLGIGTARKVKRYRGETAEPLAASSKEAIHAAQFSS